MNQIHPKNFIIEMFHEKKKKIIIEKGKMLLKEKN